MGDKKFYIIQYEDPDGLVDYTQLIAKDEDEIKKYLEHFGYKVLSIVER